jgi:hypothetical protein
MTIPLQQIQDRLKSMVLHYIEAQKIDIEPSYDTKVNSAETHVRVIAEKRLPFLVYDFMKKLHILNRIEFEQPEANVSYVIQVIASITNFSEIWDECLARYGAYTQTQLALNDLFELADEMEMYMETLMAFTTKAGKKAAQ